MLFRSSTFLKKPGALLNSLALKQAPKVYQTLLHKYFTTNKKEYIKLIKEKDIYELTELLISLDQGLKLNDVLSTNKTTIEEVSSNQLNQISNLFNQGETIQ